MKHSPAKVNILKRIRKALNNRTPIPYPKVGSNTQLFKKPEGDIELRFIEALKEAGGEFMFCDGEADFYDKLISLSVARDWEHVYCWNKEIYNALVERGFRKCRIGKNLDKADCGVLTCEALIARSGSALVSSTDIGGRSITIVPPVSIIVANGAPILEEKEEGLAFLAEKYGNDWPGSVSFISGPGKTLVFDNEIHKGALGASELFLFYID